MKYFLCYVIPFSGESVIETKVLYVEAVDEDQAEQMIWNDYEDVVEILKIEEIEEEGD